MKSMGFLGWVAFLLVIIGGLNWGLVGFFHFNVVDYLFGASSMVTRVIYCAVGVAAIWSLFTCCGSRCKS